MLPPIPRQFCSTCLALDHLLEITLKFVYRGQLLSCGTFQTSAYGYDSSFREGSTRNLAHALASDSKLLSLDCYICCSYLIRPINGNEHPSTRGDIFTTAQLIYFLSGSSSTIIMAFTSKSQDLFIVSLDLADAVTVML